MLALIYLQHRGRSGFFQEGLAAKVSLYPIKLAAVSKFMV